MQSAPLLNCWDYMFCPEESKQKCRVYKHELGRSCWFGDGYVPKTHRDFMFCSECPWFKKLH